MINCFPKLVFSKILIYKTDWFVKWCLFESCRITELSIISKACWIASQAMESKSEERLRRFIFQTISVCYLALSLEEGRAKDSNTYHSSVTKIEDWQIYTPKIAFLELFFFITVLVQPLCYEFPSCSWLFEYSSVKCYLLSKTVPFFPEKVACLQLFWKIKFKITLKFFIRGLLMLHSTIK